MKFVIKYQKLFYRALLIAIIILSGNQIFIQYWLNQKSEEGTVINIAGRQRMLSQRINLLLLRDNPDDYRYELDSLIASWKKNHSGLIGTQVVLGYRPIVQDETKKKLQSITPKMDSVIALVKDFQNGTSSIKRINQLIDDYLIEMDRSVFMLSKDADSKLVVIVFIELALFSISVFMFLIEMRLIFFPVINKLGETIDEKDVLLREKKSNILWKHTEYLKSLHAISISKVSSEGKIIEILNQVQSYLGLPVGIISQIENEEYTVKFSTENELNISKGDTYSVTNTICDITLNHVKPNVLFNDQHIFYEKDLQNSDYHNHDAVKSLPLKTYIGVALNVNSKFYGTINFSSTDTRESFEEEEILMFLQAKEAVVYELQRIERRKLEEENEKLALIAKSTHNAVIITDDQGSITWTNDGFTKLTGYTLDEVIDLGLENIHQGPESELESVNIMNEAIQAGRSIYVELVNYHKNGKPYWVGIDLQPIFDMSGKLEKFIAIESDITEQVKLRLKNEELAIVAKKTNNAVVITDKKSHISWVNDGFLRLTGYSKKEVIGISLESLFINQKTNPSNLEKLKNALKGGTSLQLEMMNYNLSSDPYWVSIDLQPIKNDDNEVMRFVLLETDITEKLNNKNNELIGEIRGEEKERNRISKDLHDGVGQMLVASRMLLNKLKPTASKDVVLNQKEVLDTLFEEMITETRLIINNLEITLGKSNNLKEAIADLITKYQRVFDGDISFKWNGKESFPDFVSAINLFRIIQEGLNNSIKYSYASNININVSNNGSLKIKLEDDGEGFDMKEFSDVNGYGLRNMRSRAKNINMKLLFESTKGEGTKILIEELD